MVECEWPNMTQYLCLVHWLGLVGNVSHALLLSHAKKVLKSMGEDHPRSGEQIYARIYPDIYLVGGFNLSEKSESQLG